MNKTPISADSHITEPPNCYVDYIDPAYRAVAPHIRRDERYGDIFIIDGMDTPIPMGLIAAAGRDPKTLKWGGSKIEVYCGIVKSIVRISRSAVPIFVTSNTRTSTSPITTLPKSYSDNPT